jgi:hypothetical protein
VKFLDESMAKFFEENPQKDLEEGVKGMSIGK